jgi:hypothetical protein
MRALNARSARHTATMQDDIERLLEYVAIGPRFSNAVLQVGVQSVCSTR